MKDNVTEWVHVLDVIDGKTSGHGTITEMPVRISRVLVATLKEI